MTSTGGSFVDDVARKPFTLTLGGTEYEVKSSVQDYDLEIRRTSDDALIGYIARLGSGAAGFIAPADVNLVQPTPHAELEEGILDLLARPVIDGRES
jgi:hypothetical protein